MMKPLVERFESHEINEEFLDIIMSGAAAPDTPKYLSRAMARASVSLLPPIVRQKLGLGRKYDFIVVDRMVVKTLGAYLNRKPIPGTPPYDASLRLGLPGEFLFKGKQERARLMAEWRAKRSPVQPAATTAVQPAE